MKLLQSVLTVGGYTMASRVTGLVRDLLTASYLGAGPVADAFFIAFRLPNLFRRMFAEGAFSAAFVPLFAGVLERDGRSEARRFAEQAMAVLVTVLLVLTIAAEITMPLVIRVMAPGFTDEPDKLALAVEFSRITFPYLLCTAVMALMAGVLNGLGRFAAAAAAPIVLNLFMLAALLLLVEPTGSAGHALSWGVAAAGVGQVLLLVLACRRNGMSLRPVLPRLTPCVRRLMRLMGPGMVGAGVMQINLLVGTMIASLLPTGAVSWLYYADRLYQLPLGVIGIAAGTVLLPEMSRRIAAGDEAGAYAAQNRTVGLTLALAAPFFVAFLVMPDLIMSALFQRGAFDAEAARRAGAVLAAYGLGLPAAVLIRSAVSSFYARSDTTTPLIASLSAVGVNIVVKLALMDTYGVVGLALGTAIGVWVNLILLFVLAYRRGWTAPNRTLGKTTLVVALASVLLAAFAWFAPAPVAGWTASLPLWHNEITLGILGAAGALIYGIVLLGGMKATGIRLARR